MLEPGHTIEISKHDYKKMKEWESLNPSRFEIGSEVRFKNYPDLSVVISDKYAYRNNIKDYKWKWQYIFKYGNQQYYFSEEDVLLEN